MLYNLYESGLRYNEQARMAALWWHQAFQNPFSPLKNSHLAAFLKLFTDTKLSHTRPDFGIASTGTQGGCSCVCAPDVRVEEEVVLSGPFCDLLHFKKSAHIEQPRALVIAPLSGHFATLLRGTIETMLPDFDVYITDWKNARDIPLSAGRFDLDDEIQLLVEYIRLLGSDTNVMAVCQPSVPALCAIALIAANDPGDQPASMTLIGGPIDARINPTAVNKTSMSHALRDFEQLTYAVPPIYRGANRKVYPGFMQIAAFISMNWQRHRTAFEEMFAHMARGNEAHTKATRKFYDEYLTVMDLPAEFYLQTIDRVFQRHLLPQKKFISRQKQIDCSAIQRTKLLVIEGEFDDICGPGQTAAALELCENIPHSKRWYHLQKDVGHYGTFNGSRWRNEIYPVIRSFINS